MKYKYISQRFQLKRSLLSGIGKTAVLMPSGFLVEAGLGMLSLGMIFFMRDVYRVSPGTMGWFSAVWMIGYFCGCLLMRPIFVRIRPRYLMITSTACMSLFILVILLFPSIIVSFICYGLFGLSLSLFWPPLLGWLSFGIEGTKLGKEMARQILASNFGMIVSPLATGLLSDISPILPVYGAISVFLIALFLITGASLALPRIRKDTHREGSVSITEGEEDSGSPLRYPGWVGLFATYAASGAIAYIFPMYARSALNMSKGIIGALFLIRAFTTSAGFLILGRFSFWHFKRAPMTVVLLLFAVMLVLLSAARSFYLLIPIMALIGPLIAFGYSNSFFHGVSGSSKRAVIMAVHEALLAGGLIAGSAAGGWLYSNYSMQTLLLSCSLLLIIAAAVQIVLFKVNK